ncbi:MAG: aminotransferase class V-fold PLP-dependent enzyme [Bacteroidota bacterium]
MENIADLFLLRKDITFLNFGSFGATPAPIFDAYQKWQRVLEAEPVQYIVFDGPGYLQTSREALAKYIGVADKDDLVFVTNPSFAVNMVVKNFPLQPGDQILTTDIEYGACDRTWEYYCAQKGAEYIKQKITLPITSKEKFIEEFFAGITPKTKAVFISHITSATALKLPVEEICAIAKQKGLITFVDGAHGPAQTSVDLANLAADFYTGACHKWMMAPKGCSFLYAHKSVQPICDPLVVSWGYKALKPSHSKFLDYHQMIGTRDFSAFLTIPDCISFMETYNWKEVSKKCHELVLSNAQRFFDLLGATPISPLTSEWIGQMISIPIKTSEPELLQRTLFTEYQIEVPIMRQGSDVYLRYSINGFNSQSDMNRLYQVVAELQQQGRL